MHFVSLRLFPAAGHIARGEHPLYKLLRYVPPHRVGFLCRFGLKKAIHFAHFGLESGTVFEGTTGLYDVFIVSILNE